MDLTIYDIIKGPVVTDKALRLNRDLKKMMLKVHPKANKPMIKKALERLFNVKVDKVNIVRRHGKIRMVNRHAVKGAMSKRAIITLAEGSSLDLFDQAEKAVVKAEHNEGAAESVG